MLVGLLRFSYYLLAKAVKAFFVEKHSSLFVLSTSDQGNKSSIILTSIHKSKPFIIEKNPEFGIGVAYPRA